MSVLSLFSIRNSVEEGFELAGYDINSKLSNAIGIIGKANQKLVKSVKQMTPLFFVGINDPNKYVYIDGYDVYAFITTSDKYHCSRNIAWTIGIKSNATVSFHFELPIPSTIDNDIDNDTALALSIACAVAENVDHRTVYSDYDIFDVFSEFKG